MRVLIELAEGRMAVPLLDNGLARFLADAGADVLLVTPAARVSSCVERWGAEDIELRHLPLPWQFGRLVAYERVMGRWLAEHGFRRIRRAMWRILIPTHVTRRAVAEVALIKEWKPDLVVSSHLAIGYGRRLVTVARKLGIPTVGNLVSWDNAHRPLMVRPDIVTCWSDQNKSELLSLCGYFPEEVKVIGAPAFDAYFETQGHWSREELCGRLGLDPFRPILLFATLGQMTLLMDETWCFEAVLNAVRDGRIRGNPQIVLRLHPTSRDAFFTRYLDRGDVTVSRYEGYIPWMAWAPWKEDIVLAGNLLRHADVCVSPGSTMTIESAIFDTPTVFPITNAYQPETYRSFIESTWLEKHFKPLMDRGLLPVTFSDEDTIEFINRALGDRAFFREERAVIRDLLLGPQDGRATERFAQVILDTASQKMAVQK